MSRHPYLPHTDEEIKTMLDTIGIKSTNELFEDIPLKLEKHLDIPNGLTEMEVKDHLEELASRNINMKEYGTFLGAGIYNHYIPSAIYPIVTKRSFLTAYTPYQAEVSQGTLQAFFEFQSMICELTAMEVANASMYDGASAVAEAALMAARVTKKDKTLIAASVHPEYVETAETFLSSQHLKLDQVGYNRNTGMLDLNDLKNKIDENTNSIIVQYPNFFGVIEDIKAIKEVLPKGVMLVVAANPIALGMLEAPGKLGADIVCGEAQCLGSLPNLGGPGLGYFATKNEFIRQMPGRIIGETKDVDGKRGFVMVLQTREQHIRRSKATSNICSNHALNAIIASVYLDLVGKKGLKDIANANYQKAHYLAEKLIDSEKFEAVFEGPFFNEFVLKSKISPKELNEKLLEQKYIGPLDLGRFFKDMGDHVLFCATEMTKKEEIDFLATFVEEII